MINSASNSNAFIYVSSGGVSHEIGMHSDFVGSSMFNFVTILILAICWNKIDERDFNNSLSSIKHIYQVTAQGLVSDM